MPMASSLPKKRQAVIAQQLKSYKAKKEEPDAYILFTSGSTGKPKGVVVGRQALEFSLLQFSEKLQLHKSDNVLASIEINFDPSLIELLVPERLNSKIIFGNNKGLNALLNEDDVTFTSGTPSMWQKLLDSGWKGNKNLKAIVGGEMLSRELVERLLPKVKELWNAYGPTECTIWTSIKKLSLDDEVITIGKPNANSTYYILDIDRCQTPIGVAGELYIGGYQLARGYLNDPELTRQKFIKNPFKDGVGGRLFKTGDKARWLPNGEVQILGRLDDQVKIRGYRIEPGEIECQLRSQKGVKDACVIVREDTVGDKRLVAYVIGSTKGHTLRTHLKAHLPAYMIPSAFVFLEQFPMTENGKLDKKSLPIPGDMTVALSSSIIKPRGPIEQNLFYIWKGVLKSSNFGVKDNFFEIGGHSLIATQVTSAICSNFNIDFDLRQIFEHPTIEELSQAIKNALDKKSQVHYTELKPQIFRGNVPLSFSQQRLWFLDKLEQNSAFYNMPFMLKLSGKIQIDALEKAIDVILDRHEALRTKIYVLNGKPYQKFVPPKKVRLKVTEVHSEKRAQKIAEVEAKKPFSLNKDNLYRIELLSLNSSSAWLLLNFHHIVADAWSIGQFISELKVLYNAMSEGQQISLPPLPVQYKDYACWQKKIFKGELKARQLKWWRKHLKNAAETSCFPTSYSRPSVQTYHGKTLVSSLSASTYRKLKKVCEAENASLYMVLLACFTITLKRYAQQKNLVIGTPVSGRGHGAVENLIGCFINTLALKFRVNESLSFSGYLKEVKSICLGAFAHQDLPFEELVKKLKLPRDLSHAPLFQTMFNLLPKDMGAFKIGKLKAELTGVDRGMSHFDLSLSMQAKNGNLDGYWEYNTDLYSQEYIEQIMGNFKNIVSSVVAQPHEPLLSIKLMTQVEENKILKTWNKKQYRYKTNTTISALFEQVAEKYAFKTAIVFKQSKRTFRQLNADSNAIAHQLISRGIRRGHVVGVCISRDPTFLAAVLGILKAGGVFLPIDPEMSEERMQHVLNDTKCKLVLSHSKHKSVLDLFEVHTITTNVFLRSAFAKNFTHDCEVKTHADDLAYVIYTSGSTGMPKGVPITHRSIVDRIQWKQKHYGLREKDVTLHVYSFIFDGAILNYFWPLCFGRRLVVAAKEERLSSDKLVALIQNQKITHVDMLPSLLDMLLANDRVVNCRTLKQVFSGGEALNGHTVQNFYKQLPKAKLDNTYGPTETSVEASVWPVEKSFSKSIAPIGRPMAGANLYVMDSQGTLLPPGVPGELLIGGEGVTRGYLNLRSLNRRAFIKNPYNQSERLYKSGDLVRYQKSGCLEYLGRMDKQVKLRGFRVELGEIESKLKQLDEVADAIVEVKILPGGVQELVAYVIMQAQLKQKIASEILLDHLSNYLPAYMLPKHIAFLDQYPKLLNGKINFKALPLPKEALSNSKPENLTSKQMAVANIWERHLCKTVSDPRSNFFELGGHSLMAVQVLSDIADELGDELPLTSLFLHPTLSGFTEQVLDAKSIGDWSPLVCLNKGKGSSAVVAIHPVGGSIFCYDTISKQNKNVSFYALQAYGLEPNQVPLESIEQMASRYARAIREKLGERPLTLLGWSFGGLIANALSNRKLGLNIEKIIAVDASAKLAEFQQLDVQDDAALLSELSKHLAVEKNKESRLVDLIGKDVKAHVVITKEYELRLLALAKAHYRALQDYQMVKMQVPVELYKASKNPDKSKTLGWNRLSASVGVQVLPGDHWAMLEGNNAKLIGKF